MSRVRIVTDSSADFRDPEFAAQHRITQVPILLQVGERSLRDGVDVGRQDFQQHLLAGEPLPAAASPTVEQFAAAYGEVSQTTDQILGIHISSKLSRAWRNAKTATDPMLGQCTIGHVDSLSVSVGLGWLVEAAVQALDSGAGLEDAVRIVRGLVPQIYGVFFVEHPAYLERVGRLGPAQAILGGMLGIRPFVTLEEGDLVAMEKVRNRPQAIEKLVEFVVEFSDLQHIAVVQSSAESTAETRALLEQLAIAFPGRHVDVIPFGPFLATFLGPGSMGIMVMENRGTPPTP